jgi:Domain of unknown function (DUF3291)
LALLKVRSPTRRGERSMAILGFYTFGIMRAPVDHPDVKGFVERIASTFESAEGTSGFLGRSLAAERPPNIGPRFFRPDQHAAVLHTLSWWRNLESVFAFAYRGSHAEALRHRKEWFLEAAWPSYVAWWIPEASTPSWQAGVERLERLHDHGPTPEAFNFKMAFDAEGKPMWLDRERVAFVANSVK